MRIFTFICLFVVSINVLAKGMTGEVVEFDISKLEPSQCAFINWENNHVAICLRSEEQINILKNADISQFGDNDGTELIKSMTILAEVHGSELASHVFTMQQLLEGKPTRSIKDNVFISIMLSPYNGCAPSYRPDSSPNDLGKSWNGGFHNPCAGEKYDLAGRVIKGHGLGNNLNLRIPPHRYVSNKIIHIGEFPEGVKVNNYDFTPDLYSPYYYEEQRLFLASIWGNKEIVSEVLKKDVDPNRVKLGSFYPLHAAVLSQNYDVIKTLLEHGAKPNMPGLNNLTPISIAEKLDLKKVVTLLKQYEK